MRREDILNFILKLTAVFTICTSMLIALFAMSSEESYAMPWDKARCNDENNAFIYSNTPITQNMTETAWIRQFGKSADGMIDWSYVPNTPIIHDGELITTAGKSILKIDTATGNTIKAGELGTSSDWGYNPVTYEETDNTIYCPLSSGRIEAIDADSLQNLWSFSTVTIMFSAGISKAYEYINNELTVYEQLSKKYYPSIDEYECVGVSLIDAIIAAHIDKYGESKIHDELDIHYDTDENTVVIAKMFGSSEAQICYCNNYKVSKPNKFSLNEGDNVFVDIDQSEDHVYSYIEFSNPYAEETKNRDSFPVVAGMSREFTFKSIYLDRIADPPANKRVVPDAFSIRIYDQETGELNTYSKVSYNDNKASIVFEQEGVYYITSGETVTIDNKVINSTGALIKVVVAKDRSEETIRSTRNMSPKKGDAFQSLSPILYSDGIVYTGFWSADEYPNYYVAVAAKSMVINGKSYEPGDLIWKYKSTGGFYWNGAVAVGDAIIVGSQDGLQGDVTGVVSDITADSHILSLNKKTGEVISDITLKNAGDICSCIVWDKEGTGRLFWSSRSGMIHSAAVNTYTGALSDVKSAYLEDQDENGRDVLSLTVNTPIVYDGKVYLGYKPKAGAYGLFAAYNADSLKNVFRVQLRGYPKGAPVLTTAYKDRIQGRPETGYLYVYTSYYEEPGGLQVIRFLPEAKPDREQSGIASDTEKVEAYDVTVNDLFDANGYSQFSVGSVIADDKGQLYYKNDSNAIFAIKKGDKIELGKAEGLKVTASGAKVTARVNKASGANGYRVLYRLNNKGGFTAVSSGSNKCTFEVPNSSVVTVRVRPEYVDAAKAVYGDYSEDITVYAAASTIKGLTAAKKAFTVKFDKHAQADGYEIQYSLKSSMASAKTLKKKGYSTVKYKVSKLKAKKKYYIRVRSYRSVDGKKYYGKWSAKKAVKTK